MLISCKADERAVFLCGFAKSDIDTVRDAQLTELRLIGQAVLAADTTTLENDLKLGNLQEVKDG